MTTEVRIATRRDFEVFYGEPPSGTIVAVVGENEGGTLVGIGGALWNGTLWYAFMDYHEELLESKKPLVKGVKRALELLSKRASRLYALPRDDRACGFLEHFGFEYDARGFYCRRN